MNPQTEFKYWAFISYSHQDNRKDRNLWGDWLHDAVENFKVPQELVGKPGRYGELVPERLFPAFQDEKELPTNADLGVAIREALEQSCYLVVICSPRAARSVYVNEEVLEFKRLGRTDRILAIIVDGEPNASEPNKGFDPALECFPPALRHPLGPDGNFDLAQRAEPIAADVRGIDGREASLKHTAHRHVLEREKLRVVAGLLGVGFDDLVQRDKERQLAEERAKTRRLWKLVAGFAALAFVAIAASVVAARQRKEALQTLSQSDFLQVGRLIGENKTSDALAYLGRSLSANPANGAALTRLTTLLTHHSWMVPTVVRKHSGPVTVLRFSADWKRMVTISTDNSVRVWDAQSDQPLTDPLKHSAKVSSALFSPNGEWIITASEDGTLRVWDVQSSRLLAGPWKPGGRLRSVRFSPDGKRIVTASDDATTRMWDAQNGQQLGKSLEHNGPVIFAEFSPDGKRIVTISLDDTAAVTTQKALPSPAPGLSSGPLPPVQVGSHAAPGSNVSRIPDLQSVQPQTGTSPVILISPLALDFSSPQDGKSVTHYVTVQNAGGGTLNGSAAIVGTNSSFKIVSGQLYSLAAGRCAQVGISYTPASATDAAVVQLTGGGGASASLGGRTASPTRTHRGAGEGLSNAIPVKPLRPSAPRGLHAIANASPEHSETVFTQYVDPDGQVGSISFSETTKSGAQVWDAQSGQALTGLLKHNQWVWSAQFSPDGKRIVTAAIEARVWSADGGELLTETLKHGEEVKSARFSPDGKHVVTASADGTARVWDAQSGQPLTEALKHSEGVSSAEFSPDGKLVLTASADQTARVWDAQSGQPLTEALKHSEEVVAAHFSSDGKQIVTVSKDNILRIWGWHSQPPLPQILKQSFGFVNSAQFSPDGKRIVTTEIDTRVWSADGGEPLTDPLSPGQCASSARFSPDGKRIVTASHDGTEVLDSRSGRPLAKIAGHFVSAVFSPDGNRIVTASEGDTARVWDALSGKSLTGPLQHPGHVWSAEFSPDGKRIVTASADGTARVWDAQSGQFLTQSLKESTDVSSAQFSPDGKRILTVSFGGIARVWDAHSGRPLTEGLRHGEYNGISALSAQFSPDGKRILTVGDSMARMWDSQSGQPLGEPLKHGAGPLAATHLSHDGRQFAIVSKRSQGNTAKVWDMPPGGGRCPSWLLQLTEAISGQELNKQGVLEPTKLNRVETINRIRQKLNQEPEDGDWAVWGRWFLADCATRTISPFSKITVPHYIENQIKENTAESLAEGERLAYGNTNLLQRIAEAREKLGPAKKHEPTN